jgi:hypothetical protein
VRGSDDPAATPEPKAVRPLLLLCEMTAWKALFHPTSYVDGKISILLVTRFVVSTIPEFAT